MPSILDEILEVKANKLDGSAHKNGCGCAACSASDAHWRVRRHQRLSPFVSVSKAVRPGACNCAQCRAKAEADNEMAGHDFWRKRRQIRHGWPVTNWEMEAETVFQKSTFGNTPNPVRNFTGMTPSRLLDRKPLNWRKVAVDRGAGWKLLDEKGNERIRYMFPNPNYKRGANRIWRHIATGYWVVRDGQGNYLDSYGRVVAPNIPFSQMTEDQMFKLHIVYSGVDNELGEFEWPLGQTL